MNVPNFSKVEAFYTTAGVGYWVARVWVGETVFQGVSTVSREDAIIELLKALEPKS